MPSLDDVHPNEAFITLNSLITSVPQQDSTFETTSDLCTRRVNLTSNQESDSVPPAMAGVPSNVLDEKSQSELQGLNPLCDTQASNTSADFSDSNTEFTHQSVCGITTCDSLKVSPLHHVQSSQQPETGTVSSTTVNSHQLAHF